MFYTAYKSNKNEDIDVFTLFNAQDTKEMTYRHTFTKEFETVPSQYDIINFNPREFTALSERCKPFIEYGLSSFYISFYIPKASGGFRKITSPTEDLSCLQTDIKKYMEYRMRFLAHDANFAYVKHRNCAEAIKVHQANGSRWFLKLDIEDFFGKCKKDYITSVMKDIYPLYKMTEHPEELAQLLEVITLDRALPQGAPTSPIFSNIAFLPTDVAINKLCKEYKLVYTRYADDILISGDKKFNWRYIERKIKEILLDTPFRLNYDKTRFGSYAGRNWNLGLMYNKDMQITVGYRNKKLLKVMLNNAFKDYTTGSKCSKIELCSLNGILNYYISIEPDYFRGILSKYESKYDVTWKELIANA